ncbi:TSC22 domain family protein 3 isoform X2 [Phyllopteryx taeniolatus]|uniref:TSC22 domain family protein 3 isoform X2 n=1 Tax=Phycodurus eques TaxID=693459 RepID=UPI002ACDBADF|nr:TSC22 domain family protein 3 isoform X2 [Phycodurus eques]XP_061642592.1 TSC22 domain family protein 3 isoform X2 [Phyllopteryx taeniolatus]
MIFSKPNRLANVATSVFQTSLPLTMSTEMFAKTSMEVAVYQLHNFSISFFSSLLGGDVVSVKLDNSASGASVVAIDNKIEQAMDLVKNHLMYAVREEVEILKEQIKELAEKNNQLERENYLLKNLASPEQLEKFQSRIPTDGLLPLDNQSVQVMSEQQTCSRNTGSAV